MGKIRKLPDDLANQIAAGEVVERPSSVVKELVENALDAGATRVRVDVDQGGIAMIRVADDGDGMSPEDARLAVERHATSKIASFEDLTRLATFGFRGEALPSIASVARLSVTTRARGAKEGVEVVVEGGAPARVKPAGCAEGTIVEARDLFYNVPARRKFLKSTPTESAHVGEAVMLAALARPDVTFVLARDGKIAREYLRAGSREERVRQVLTEPLLQACRAERGPSPRGFGAAQMRLEAFLAPPERARAGAVALHVFVNGRPVTSRPLARAVAQGYGSVLEAGRYPVGVVYVEVPASTVDVNVHPQKTEVRFTDARALYDAMTRELYAGLSKAFGIPALGPPSRPWLTPRPTPPSVSEPLPATAYTMGTPATIPSPALTPALFSEPAGFYGLLTFLAQVRATFLVCEGTDGLYILDQHAAAERVAFDRLRRGFAARAIATQRLLIPEIVEFVPAEVAALEEATNDVASLGLEVRPVGPSAVAVHAVPQILARASPERLVRDVVLELTHHAGRAFRGVADLVLATMACHGSIRAGDAVSADEARALLKALDAVDFSGHCPHGRPVVTRIAFAELEHKVGRT